MAFDKGGKSLPAHSSNSPDDPRVVASLLTWTHIHRFALRAGCLPYGGIRKGADAHARGVPDL